MEKRNFIAVASLALVFGLLGCDEDSNSANSVNGEQNGSESSNDKGGILNGNTDRSSMSICNGEKFDSVTHFCAMRNGVVERIYKKVFIKAEGYSETWMAENLNFETPEGSFCYDDDESNCAIYGRLYTWAAAVGKSEEECPYDQNCSFDSLFVWQVCNPSNPAICGIASDSDFDIQGACPDGWHLPTYFEWEKLIKAVGGEEIAGQKLKSASGWNESGNGSDAVGFSALPGGYQYVGEPSEAIGHEAAFWTTSQYVSPTGRLHSAYRISFVHNSGLTFPREDTDKLRANSVRCVQNK